MNRSPVFISTLVGLVLASAAAIALAGMQVEDAIRDEGSNEIVFKAPTVEDQIDAVRLADLDSIANALSAFRVGTLALSTNGQVQTVCAYPEDSGCIVLPDVHLDPMGLHYYWRDDGRSLVVYAQRSADETIPCYEQPEHLAELGSVMCVRR